MQAKVQQIVGLLIELEMPPCFSEHRYTRIANLMDSHQELTVGTPWFRHTRINIRALQTIVMGVPRRNCFEEEGQSCLNL